MTLQKLLTKINDEKPNAFGNERLISFVNEIEGTVRYRIDEGKWQEVKAKAQRVRLRTRTTGESFLAIMAVWCLIC